MLITDIKKRRNLYDVFADGELFASIDSETMFIHKIKKGSEFDNQSLLAIVNESDGKKARDKAFRILEYRNHSKQELFDKLKRTYSEDAAQQAVDKIEKIGLINDESFARRYAEELLFSKRFSKWRAKIELEHKGISSEIIQNVLDEYEINEKEQIEYLLNKKYRGAFFDEKTKRRAIAFLQRYGYRFEDIISVIKNKDVV